MAAVTKRSRYCLLAKFLTMQAFQRFSRELMVQTGQLRMQAAWLMAKPLQLGESASAALESADSGRYLQSVGAALKTGPTGTNVMDIALVLKSDS